MTTESLPAKAAPEPVAVIGIGCRFSGEASSVNGLWEMIRSGRTGHCKVPSSRYDSKAWYHPSNDRKGAINHDTGFFLEEDPSLFDAPFFSITAKEAAGMDPAQRLLLEVAYEAFENGGIPMESLPRSNTAVYSGCMTNDYELLSTRDLHDMPHNSATGNGRTMLANRVSWFFDLRGPSVMMDTACSSSLTALHLATQAMRSGECGMALVTGASLILDPNFTQRLSYMHMLSPDGISHSFDSRANGYGRGEGLGAVLLKSLSAAMADGDAIRAIIRETGINQDGRTPGITMPNADAQADLIQSVYKTGHLSMRETALFEAHGTGTQIGDPTELSAIGKTMGAARQPDDEPIYVGSVKGNLGHTEGAAGVASLIKTVLCLENGLLVPNAGFSQLNPKIRADEWRLRPTNEAAPWPEHLPQRASINSFGFGGSNAHAIIESASQYFGKCPAPIVSSENPSPRLIVFSSHDKAGISRISKRWSSFVEKGLNQGDHLSLRDIAYTMSNRRSQLPFRSFAVADAPGTLHTTLEEGLPTFPRARRAGQSNLAFIFTGQGAQWAGMGKGLLNSPVFGDSIARSQQILSTLNCPWKIEEEIRADASSSHINQPDRSQPISCALQIALVELLASWGVLPNATLGHSSGEIGAAYAAGFLSHEDAIRIAYFRGVLSRRLAEDGKRGSMMAVGLSTAEIQSYLDDLPDQSVVVACENSPSSITMSGDEEQINELEQRLKTDGHFARKLRVNTAYHSPHMQILAEEYQQSIKSIAPGNRHQDTIAMFSSVTKERVYAKDLNPSYWVRNMVSRVEFTSAVTQVLTHTQAAKGRRRPLPVKWNGFIEIGPHEALKGPFNQTVQSVNATLASLPYTSLILRGKDAQHTSLQAAGILWSIGASIDLEAVNSFSGEEGPPKLVSVLPSYSWNHQSSFWHESISSSGNRLRKTPRHDILGVPMSYQSSFESRWRNFLRVSEIPWLADHVVAGSIIFPAAGMVGIVAEAAQQISDPKQSLAGVELYDVEFLRGMVVPPSDQGLETVLGVKPHQGVVGWYQFELFSISEGTSWVQHAKGGFAMHYEDGKGHVDSGNWRSIVRDVQQTQDVAIKADLQKVYDWLGATGGVALGPSFQSIAGAFFCPGEGRMWISGVVHHTERTMPHERESPYFMHPTSLDALFQAAVLSRSEALSNQNANIPVGVERLYLPTHFSLDPGDTFSVHTKTYGEDGELYSDCVASDSAWSQPQVMLQGVRLGRVPVRKATQGGKEALQSRFSSLVWKAHAESSYGSQSAPGHDDALNDWIDLISHTYGGSHAVLIMPQGKIEDMVETVRHLAPLTQAESRIAHLTILRYGPSHLSEVEESTFQDLIPDARMIAVDTIQEINTYTLAAEAFDLVLFSEPIVLDSTGLYSTLSLSDTITKPDGWLVLASSYFMPSQSVDQPDLNNWKIKDSDPRNNFVLLHRGSQLENLDATIYVLVLDRSHIPDHLHCSLAHVFAVVGSKIQLVEVSDIPLLVGKTVVSLLEIQRPWVSQWTQTEFDYFKALLQARYILWVSQVAERGTADHSEFGATTGLLRTLRNEQRGTILPHVQLDVTGGMNNTEVAQGLLEIIQLTIQSGTRQSLDLEFRLRNGKVLVPRLVANEEVDEAMQSMTHGPQVKLGNLSDDLRPLRLQGDILDAETLRWEADLELEKVLLPDQVEVQVQFQTISVPSQSDSHSPEARISALEATGTVRHVGLKAGEKLTPGDLVTVFYCGDVAEVATRVRVPVDAVSKIQPDADLIQSASMPVAYTLAYISLLKAASLVDGSSVLVVGSVCQTLRAIIECCLASGIAVYVAVDNTDSVDSLETQYPALSNRVFFLQTGLVSKLLHLTGGRRVSATISLLSGSATRIAAQCIAPGGYYVDLSGDINPATLPKTFFARGCIVTSLQLQKMLKSQQDDVSASFREVSALLGSQHTIHPYMTFPVCDLKHALHHARKTGSRVILDLEAPGAVPILHALPPPVTLGTQNTYILAGGLGTIGLALSETLVAHGAKSIVFLGRSGSPGEAQQATLQRFNALGCETHVRRCDITKVDEIRSFISEATEKGWQIKGVIQCTTVLKDSMFAKMTFEQWKLSTQSKILGTLNLHHLLPSSLDFFITLSSVASLIGNMGQSNYSAGNAVMDSLMSWRRNHQLCGQSINIGLVPDASGVGDIDESSEDRRKRYSHLEGTEITIQELQSLLYVILQNPSAVPPQLVAGIIDGLPRQDAASWQLDRKFDHRIRLTKNEEGAVSEQTSSSLKSATTTEDAAMIITRALQAYLGKSMAAESDSIDTELPLSALGVDSLRASEVQNWVLRETGAELSSFDFLGPQPLRALADKIAAQSPLVVLV